MDAWMTSQALARKLRGLLACMACIFDVLAMGVITTRHWKMFERLVKELNVCTVYI